MINIEINKLYSDFYILNLCKIRLEDDRKILSDIVKKYLNLREVKI